MTAGQSDYSSDHFRRTSIRSFVRVFAGLLVVGPLLLAGCQQPVANPQSRGGGLFGFSQAPKLFGGNTGLASNSGNYGGNPFGGGSFGVGLGSGSGIFSRPQTAGANPSGQFPNPFANPNTLPNANTPAANQAFAGMSNELQNLNQRLTAYDSDNQLLNTEVAALKQKLQLANQYNQTLKDQLADTSGRIQQSEMEKQAALQQMANMQMQFEQLSRQASAAQQNAAQQNASATRQVGFGGSNAPTQLAGATIRANNSLMQRLGDIQIPGGQARMDGDVIRIEFPSDNVFVPGTYQIQPSQLPVMQNIVATIRQNFPKQIVGIEAHWDMTPLNPATVTDHQLTATQALAVFENLVRLGLPKNQIFTMGMASNRPRYPQGISNGVSPNRRIELVLYPETYDGSY